MTTLSFDTLKLARRLEGAGFSPKQAGDTAEALAESLRETSDLATRQDLIALPQSLLPHRRALLDAEHVVEPTLAGVVDVAYSDGLLQQLRRPPVLHRHEAA